jgi:hypothetical protein
LETEGSFFSTMGSHDGEVSSTNHSLVVSSIEQDQRVSLLDLYSDELEDDFEDASPTNMPLCSSKLNTPSSESLIAKFKWKQEWEFRYQPKLEPLLLFQNDLKRFENLHACGVTSMELLTSMAYVVSQRDTIDTIHVHTQKLKRVARHLSVGRTPRDLKLMTLKTLVECLSPLTASWQFCDSVIDGTLDFLILGHQEWEFMDHTHFTLLQQIRFLSLQYKAREKERVALVEKTGDRASLCISAGAKLVEAGMQNSLPIIEKHLDTCAKKIKDLLKSGEYPLMVDRDAVVCMTFSDGAKRLSERAKISTTCAVSSIRDISALGLDLLVQKIKPLTNTQEQNLPPECIEAIRACGKVGMAAIGAAAIVGEAIIETSRALVQKTGAVSEIFFQSSINCFPMGDLLIPVHF